MKRLMTAAMLAALVLWPSLTGAVNYRNVPYVAVASESDTLFTVTAASVTDSTYTSEIVLIQDVACSFHFGNYGGATTRVDSTNALCDSITITIETSWDGVIWETLTTAADQDWETSGTQFSKTADLDEITNTVGETIPAPIARYARMKIANLSLPKVNNTTPDTLVRWFVAVLATQ